MIGILATGASATHPRLVEPTTQEEITPATLPVRAGIGPGPYYVGQGIPVQVVAIGAGERPEIRMPKVEGGTLAPVGSSFRPLTSSAIGDLALGETNAFAYLYRLVPERAGTLMVPGFEVLDGHRRGLTRPIRIEVRNPPTTGRPASFAGGIGPLAIRATVEPDRLRVGQTFEYRVDLEGPGALGTTRLPGEFLTRLEALPIQPEIEVSPAQVSGGGEVRTFTIRLRPTQVGEVGLPPVRLAWFDPATERFQTVAGSSPTVTVSAVPELDPGAITYGSREPSDAQLTSDRRERLRRILTSFPFWATWWIPLAASLLVWAVMARRSRPNAARCARGVARELERRRKSTDISTPEFARRTLDGLTRYLSLAVGRPEGELTAEEARNAFSDILPDQEFATRVLELVRRCEAILYAPDRSGPADGEWEEEAVAIFRSLGRRPELTPRECSKRDRV